MKHSRRFSLIVALLLIVCAACDAPALTSPEQGAPRTSSQGAPAKSKRPKLLLVIVVDQFRYDYLLRFRDDYTSGIARLLNGGAVFHDAHYLHYPTVTAVGHSTIMSGATPSVSGIVGNEWFDRESNESVTSVSDRSAVMLGNVVGGKSSSPHRLLVSTVGDELKMAGRNSKVIGISIKDRSAILPVGHMADAAYWFDNDSIHFVSSTYYMKDLPAWVKQVNSDRPTYKYLGKEWRALDARPGDKAFCSLVAGVDVPFCGPLENTPFGNEMLEDFAEKARTPEAINEWRSALTTMAALPNLHVKISGPGMFTNGVTFEHARQWIRDIVQIFGVERTIYGSNFPLEKLHASYSDFFGHYHKVLAEYPEAEQRKVLYDNALTFYRL